VKREEFAALVVGYLSEVTAYARRLARTRSDADDLVQMTYERAFSRWMSLRDPRACRAWLFAIARHIHIDQGRSMAARPDLRLVHDAEATGPEPFVTAEVVERMDARQLEAALERIPHDQREAVLLCDLWGFRYDEIAEITGCPLGTVQSRIARGRGALAAYLTAEGTFRGKGRVR
jgi:RNA polymerase sigma-70 factor (ECF subfamily)